MPDYFSSIPMKNVVIVLLFVAGFCLPDSSFAQCQNGVALKKTSIDVGPNSGAIEISITTSKSFTCTLNVEKGTGPQKVELKKGSGNQTIEFKNLPRDNAYQVVVEFAGENPRCKTLQKSQIIIE
jgi:hypothetical protein